MKHTLFYTSAALHGRLYDSHTHNQATTSMKSWPGIEPHRIYVDKGYQGRNYPHKIRVFRSGQKREMTPTIKCELKRRSVVEPLIGHMKNEERLVRNYLKETLGDRLNVLFVAAGYNLKLILRWLKKIFSLFLSRFIF